VPGEAPARPHGLVLRLSDRQPPARPAGARSRIMVGWETSSSSVTARPSGAGRIGTPR
jgi:hypothetical protein